MGDGNNTVAALIIFSIIMALLKFFWKGHKAHHPNRNTGGFSGI